MKRSKRLLLARIISAVSLLLLLLAYAWRHWMAGS